MPASPHPPHPTAPAVANREPVTGTLQTSQISDGVVALGRLAAASPPTEPSRSKQSKRIPLNPAQICESFSGEVSLVKEPLGSAIRS